MTCEMTCAPVPYPKLSITGDIGSGKTAVSRLLQQATGYPRYSTGDLQRRIAARYGMTTLELNRYSETHPAIDEEIDGESIRLGATDESFIIDSRIAWHFIPHSFKVYLTVDPRVAAERLVADRGRTGESYDDVATARDEILKRRESEVERFRRTYGIHLADLDNYDLVIDTSQAPPREVAEAVLNGFREWTARGGRAKASDMASASCSPL
jgi:cytidylate kinase